MGAPKQKWTAEEEAALKAGIHKYGVGKWSTILKDPEFNAVLRSRSNVDLKDKWRNLNCMTNGSGSRNRANTAQKNIQLAPKHEEEAALHNVSVVVDKEPVVIDAAPPAAVTETIQAQAAASRKQFSRLDDLVLEAITKLKEPRGSSRQTIAEYIENQQLAPADFERLLAASLRRLTEKGRLVKVKHQYRIAPRQISQDVGKDSSLLLPNGAKKEASEAQRHAFCILTKAQVDAELQRMMSMSASEAAAAAALAVAEAEAALAEAEAAAMEAEEAEAEAEAARCFADAAQKALHCTVW